MKTCSKCLEAKELGEFHKHSGTLDGYTYNCKACRNTQNKKRLRERREQDPTFRELQDKQSRDRAKSNPERTKKEQKLWREKNKEDQFLKKKAWKLERIYGLTLDEYYVMIESQNHLCAICQKPDSKWLAVDHCHSTGKVRSLLCNRCNTSIGKFEDSPELLTKAASYLLKHKE